MAPGFGVCMATSKQLFLKTKSYGLKNSIHNYATATAMRGRMVTALRKKLRRIDKGEPVDDVLAERVEYVAATGTATVTAW